MLIGGYFGTWHDTQEITGLPLAATALRRAGASPGAGVLVALPAGACGLAETSRVLAWLAGQGAGQCGPCVFGLPAIAADFAQLASGRPDGPVLDRLERRLSAVIGRGACRHPDGAVRLARSALSAFAADVKSHVSRRTCLTARHGRHSRDVLPLPQAGRHGDLAMKQRLAVNPIACTGHGICAELLPELIGLDEWGFPIVADRDVPYELRPLAKRAVRLCPTLALRLDRGNPARTPTGSPPARVRADLRLEADSATYGGSASERQSGAAASTRARSGRCEGATERGSRR